MAVRRGEAWTASGGAYAGKPPPAVILQSDQFSDTASITLVPCTLDPTKAPLFRLDLKPDRDNGLKADCRLMVDKITTVPKSSLGTCVGQLSDDDMTRLERAVVVFLGMA